MFKIIFVDHNIDKEESYLILKYAMQLGCGEDTAKTIISKSIKLFSADIDFEDYKEILSII